VTHIPVLLRESVGALNIRPGGVYVDGTVGLGGHSYEIASRLFPENSGTGRLLAIDRDETALTAARERLARFGERITYIHGNFQDITDILKEHNIAKADGILCDFGVSSPQLDDAARGFSHNAEAKLDMRMDRASALTAYEIINTWDEKALRKILFEYGEERYALRIAGAIMNRRKAKPIETTTELSDLIKNALPAKALHEAQHPAKRTFQAVRIAANDELGAIERLLETAPELLNPAGRLACISFHSLEDRLVKNAFRAREDGCTCPKSFPICVCGFTPTLKVLTRKPITASDEELTVNPRARSAKLRIAEKI
jgi:16S rRNA (cytosine1402-N4)-methyltransferase